MKVVFVYLKNNDKFVNSNVHYDDKIILKNLEY